MRDDDEKGTRGKQKADKELLRQVAEIRSKKKPTNEDINSIFEELSLHYSESKENKNVWRMLTFPSLTNLKCEKSTNGHCKHCAEAMLSENLRWFCKEKALELALMCLQHDELKKMTNYGGFDHAIYIQLNDDYSDGWFEHDDESYGEDPSDKLEICPIGERKVLFHNEHSHSNEDCDTVHSFLCKSRVFDPILSARLLFAFPSDDTPAVCIYFDDGCWYDGGTYYPELILVVTNDVAVVYASMKFRYDWSTKELEGIGNY